MTPWLMVAGDLTPLGGMDTANHALARYLAARGEEVHLVTHRAWPDLAADAAVTVHRVWRPFNRHLLGSPLLSRAGVRVWRRLSHRGVRTIVNGGNCHVAGANWVHYLHAAYAAHVNGSTLATVKNSVARRLDLDAEQRGLRAARVIICNSRRTRQDVIERLGVPEDRVRVVYYGSDPLRFAQVSATERAAAQERLGFASPRVLVGFVGALGDRRKAFDTLFAAWSALCRRSDWDAELVVVGSGAELPMWRQRADQAGLRKRVHFLGFRDDVPTVLAALDALVHPARYEAYGLSVHEAMCRGIPAFVSRTAGVAEHYPAALSSLLIEDPNDDCELADRLLGWRQHVAPLRALVEPVSSALRARTWDMMAADIVACVEQSDERAIGPAA
jgi:glycosyltransferase involved in cell wall biosynthesis